MTAAPAAALDYQSRTPQEPSLAPRVEPVLWGARGEGPLSDVEADRYEADGFVQFERLLDSSEMAALEADLAAMTARLAGTADERVVLAKGGDEIRSVFEVHLLSDAVAALARDPRLLARAEQILGSPAYIHQSRVNFKPGLRGKEFYWHSDFETWHWEDGMPQMRAVSVSLNLTPNHHFNGSLMIMPGSHRTFVGCAGATPDQHYRESLKAQQYGTPSDEALTTLAERHGIAQLTAPPGSAVFFDSNCMHGSNGNITPMPRHNVFLVFNSVENSLVEPYGGTAPRPSFIAAREVEPLR
jgi:ectoine hydroxylase